jgi:hypothetical protein
MAYQLANMPDVSVLNPVKASAIVDNFVCKGIVDGYSRLRYGTITEPERLLKILPPPVAPRTEAEMHTWNPANLDAANAVAYEEWKANAIAMIEEDERNGDYTPSGSLLDLLIENKWLAIGGAVALVILLRPRN